MIRKILFTLAVIAIVYFVYRFKRGHVKASKPSSDEQADSGHVPTALFAYLLIGFMVVASTLFFGLSFLEQRESIQLRIISPDNRATIYQVKRKDIDDRSFTTSDGRVVRLGLNDRMEIIEP